MFWNTALMIGYLLLLMKLIIFIINYCIINSNLVNTITGEEYEKY